MDECDVLLALQECDLKIARLTYDRMMQLTGNQNPFVSEQQIDQAISSLGSAKANYALYRTRLAKTRIQAPFAGYVGIRRISPGDYVQTGQDLVNLEDLHTLKIDFKVPETFLTRLSIGQRVEIVSDAVRAQNNGLYFLLRKPRDERFEKLRSALDYCSPRLAADGRITRIGI